MTDFTSVAIPKPKDWQALERHCRRLFELSFSDPAVQNNGRAGQPQHGVDIFGRRDGGMGRLVGIQCKGKDADYGGEVSKTELHGEVKKTQDFVPPIEEFILLTTAPNDQKIQQFARELELELKRRGRALVIQVWGWERVQQEICRFPEAIREFHPDASPFTDQILSASKSLKHLVSEGAEKTGEKLTGIEQALALVLDRLPPIAFDISARTDALDKELHDQIDGYRDLLRRDKPRTALELLMRLKDRIGPDGPQRIRYRLLSNIGAAYYNLGEYDQASDFLLEAAPLNLDDPGSFANKAVALLIKDKRSEANAVVVDALNRFPDSQELVLPRLQTLPPGETVESVWQSLSEKAKGTATAFTFRLGSLREVGDPSWRRLAEEGCRLYPDDVGLRILRAESVIDRLLQSDPGAVGLMTSDAPSHSDFREAAEFLEKAWRDSMGQETPSKPVCGHNAALAWSILGEPERAAPILDNLIAVGADGDDTKRLRVAVHRRQGETAEAIRLANQLSDLPMHRLLRADLEIDRSPTEARKLIKDQSIFVSTNDIIGAALIVVESYVKEGNFDAALAEARLLEAKLPGHPQGPLALYKVKKAQSSADLKEDIYRAAALLTEDTDFTSRFLVAEAFSSVQLFDDTVDCLVDHTSRRLDSPALRFLVAAAASADRRVTLRKILLDVPRELADEPFYAKAKIALAIHTGSIAEAESEIRGFLSRDPSSLELQIQLFQALFRQNKMDELRAAVAIPADRFKGSAFDFIKLAHFKDDFGDWREAHTLAYRTLLSNPSSQAVIMGYIGVFIRPGHSRQLSVETPNVESDVAVALENEQGATTIYILEPDATLRPSAHYLPLDHAIAKLLFGKKIGDSVEMPDKSAATITWIKPKILQALHDVIDNFPNRFPEAEGFERVRIDIGKEGGLEPILERLRDRHEAAEQVGKLYDSGAMTLSIVGKSLGCDPVEAMVGLANFGSPIRVCTGTHLERNKALAAIEANDKKGCVVDAITLHVIRRLKIEDAVTSVCGQMHIVDETSLHLQRKIYKLVERIDEPDMSLSYRDGQYYRTEITSDQKKDMLRSLEADRIWLTKNATIVPAEGSRDPNPEWRPLIERFGSSFLDEIRAAEGAGLMLLSEDESLRALGEADYVVPAVWLQPVLMRALDLNLISDELYRDAIVAMIDSRFQFISVTSQLLLSAIRGTSGHALPPSFEKLASKVGGKAAELSSHASIAYRTSVAVWHDRRLTSTVRQAVIGRLLERLIDERREIEVRAIIY